MAQLQIVTPPFSEHLFDYRTYVRLSVHSNTRSAGEHLFGQHRARQNPQPVGVGGSSGVIEDRRSTECHKHHHQHADDQSRDHRRPRSTRHQTTAPIHIAHGTGPTSETHRAVSGFTFGPIIGAPVDRVADPGAPVDHPTRRTRSTRTRSVRSTRTLYKALTTDRRSSGTPDPNPCHRPQRVTGRTVT